LFAESAEFGLDGGGIFCGAASADESNDRGNENESDDEED